MANRLTVRFDEDTYDEICDEHDKTGKDKGTLVNERLRIAYNIDAPTLADTLWPVFGQSLFIAGFVAAMFVGLIGGVGMSMLGLGLMVGSKVDEYRTKHDVPATTAFVKVLGA